MATLNIGGKRVKVGDEFLSLTPEQQQATVDEIAAKIGIGAPEQPASTDPGFSPYDTGATRLSGGPGVQPEQSLLDKFGNATMATVNGLSASVPFLQNTTDAIGGTIAQLTGGNYGDYIQHQKDVREGYAERAPLARIGGEVGGMIAGTGVLGASKLGAEALGLTGNFGQRVLNSGLSSAGLSTLDALSNGESGAGALTSGLVGGLTGAGLPLAGEAARGIGRGLRDNVVRPIMTMANRENEVTRRITGGIMQDVATGSRMSPEMDALANNAGAEVVNADRFGSAIRTLARTSANISPEADNLLKGVTENRFLTQGKRAVNYLRTLMGGATDDLALQDAIRKAADDANSIAYGKANADPKARAIWTPQIRELMQSDKFRAAVDAAESRGSDKAAVAGVSSIKNPFKFDEFGQPNLKMRSDRAYERLQMVIKTRDKAKIAAAKAEYKMAKANDGPDALPSLQFWNQVKINLDTMIAAAKPTATNAGDRALYADLTAMKQKLLSSLDNAVPSYADARRGAAGFFGAEDAIDAGRKAFNSPKAVPEIQRAVMAAKPAEREALAVGYSSEMIDAINASKDRVNVINSIFGSESARARNVAVLGHQRARELEAYVKMEQVLHQLKEAVGGNSTTAKQLIAAGLMGGGAGLGGWAASGGDIGTGMSAAVLFSIGRRGLQVMGKQVDDKVMKRVAEILTSPDPKLLERAIQNASLSQQHIDAIDAIMRGLAIGARGGALAAVAAN